MTTTARSKPRWELHVPEGWSAFVLLALMLILLAGSITEAGYDDKLNGLVSVTLGAVVMSLLLVKSRFPGMLIHLFSLVFGTAWNAFVISFQLPTTFTAREKLLEMGYRIADWVQRSVIGRELGTDPLMFAVVMCILLWLLTYSAVWFAFRAHSLWAVLLPTSIALTLNLYYGPERINFFMVPYVLLALLFTSRLNLFSFETDWKKLKIRYSTDDVAFTFLRYGIILALIAIILAWVIPTASRSDQAEIFFSRFSEPWDRVKSEWIRLFSTLRSERIEPTYSSFGTSLGLGGPVSLGNLTLMDVRSPAGRYWRAAVYDTYLGDGWTLEDTESLSIEAGELPGEMAAYEARRTITQTFTLYMPGTAQVYALGQPEQFSLPVKAEVIRAGPSGQDAPVETIAMVSSRYRMPDVESYVVVSHIPSADEGALRQAGRDYPAWTQRYLQLPNTLPQRVRDLALEITAPYENDYDKATAIQDYLREYTYNEKIVMPPEGVDRVDYFLFEMKEGYCNYFASAMVVMARSVGIPARLAAGYARGELDPNTLAYRVREFDSHAWVEVYLPRFGWIEFEPTAGEPAIVRPRAPTSGGGGANPIQEQDDWEEYLRQYQQSGGAATDPNLLQAYLAEQRRQARIRTWTRIGAVAAVSLLIIVGAAWLGRNQAKEGQPADTYYERMVRQAGWWGLKMQPAQTPHEYATLLAAQLADIETSRLVFRITDAYVGERFGKKNPARYQPDFAWRDLSPSLWRWGVGHWWRQQWQKKPRKR